MSSRFQLSFPQGHDPNMHKEEMLTLARTTSQHQGSSKGKVQGQGNGNTSNMASTSKPAIPPPVRRKNFVFTDPVAFRYRSLPFQYIANVTDIAAGT